MSETVLHVKDLDVQYYTDEGVVYANNKVNFSLRAGERLGLVGESGSGKSTMALALLRMIKDAVDHGVASPHKVRPLPQRPESD